jgi:hypothetical protein
LLDLVIHLASVATEVGMPRLVVTTPTIRAIIGHKWVNFRIIANKDNIYRNVSMFSILHI